MLTVSKSQVAQWERILLPSQEPHVRALGREDPLEKEKETRSSVLVGNIHRLRSLAGCRPCGSKESDMTERTLAHTHTHTTKSCVSSHLCDTIPPGIPWTPPKQKGKAPLKSGWYTVLTVGPITESVLFFRFLFCSHQ